MSTTTPGRSVVRPERTAEWFMLGASLVAAGCAWLAPTAGVLMAALLAVLQAFLLGTVARGSRLLAAAFVVALLTVVAGVGSALVTPAHAEPPPSSVLVSP